MTIGRYLAIGLIGLASCQTGPYRDSKTYSDRGNRGVARQVDDIRNREVRAVSDSRQNARNHTRAFKEAEELHDQVMDLTNYRVVGEIEPRRVVTLNDQSDDKGEYLSITPAEGAEVLEVVYGRHKQMFNINDLETNEGRVKVYLEDLSVNRLRGKVGVVFYGQQSRTAEIEPDPRVELQEQTMVEPTDQAVHQEVMQRIENASVASRERFEQNMRALAERLLGVNIQFLRGGEEIISGYAQRQEAGHDDVASKITTENVDRYQANVEQTTRDVESIFNQVEQAKAMTALEARLRERLERMRAQELTPKEN